MPKSPRILAIGDLILDIYNHGVAVGLSLETPTVVVRHEERKMSHGGAGLFVRNILELGGNVTFITLIGADDYGAAATAWTHVRLEKYFITEENRPTTVKERFWVKTYKLLQWDHLNDRPITRETEAAVIALMEEKIKSADRLMVSDYRHGLLTESLAKNLVEIARAAKVPLYLDSQLSKVAPNHHWYKGAAVVCLNEKEALGLDPAFTNKNLRGSLARLKDQLSAQEVVIKLGEKGCAALIGGEYHEVAPHAVTAVDTAGAGDAFFAMLAVTPGPLTLETLVRANRWAALSTTTLGPNPPMLSQLTAE